MHGVRSRRAGQHGVSLLVVLMILGAMALGGLLHAHATFVNTRLAGNLTHSEVAAQAADIGISTAFEEMQALTSDNTNLGGWYFAMPQPEDADGLPSSIDWDDAREITVGAYSVRYVVERYCRTLVITNPLNDCQMSENEPPVLNMGGPQIVPPPMRTYRVTVRVAGPRATTSWAQALLERP
jgi:uncharacterized membrane protein